MQQQIAVMIAAAALCAATLAFAQRATDKPRVPPGVDPGGLAVAVIGNGVDYTKADVARRLARDGEGELVGWDFLDEDRRPFERCVSACAAEALAPLLLQPARLIVIRASIAAPQSLVRAMQLAFQVEARVVLLTLDPPAPAEFLAEAAARFPGIAIIARVTVPEGGKAPRAANYVGIAASYVESAAAVAKLGAAAVRCGTQTAGLDGTALLACAERLAAP